MTVLRGFRRRCGLAIFPAIAAGLLTAAAATETSANFKDNITVSGKRALNAPSSPVPATLFDEQTTDMLRRPGEYPCEDLSSLPHEAKNFLLQHIIGFQVPGMLPKIIGPDCTMFGDITPLAIVKDPVLIVGGAQQEILYYLPEMEMMILSEDGNQSVAYGMKAESGSIAAQQYLDHRTEAQTLADFTRRVSEGLSSLAAEASSVSAAEAQNVAALSERSAVSSAPGTNAPAGGKSVSSAVLKDKRTLSGTQPGIAPTSRGGESPIAPSSAKSAVAADEKTTAAGTPRIEPPGENMLPVIGPEESGTSAAKKSAAPWLALATIVILVVVIAYRKMRRRTSDENIPAEIDDASDA